MPILYITYFDDAESQFEVGFLLFPYQMSQNHDQNYQKNGKNPFVCFYDWKHFFEFNLLFWQKINAYTLIGICWIQFFLKKWHEHSTKCIKISLEVI